MDKHSPAPWTFERKGNWIIRDSAGNALQCDETYYPWVSDNEADWHLQAAAPDLLDALQDAVTVLLAIDRNRVDDDVLRRSQFAIAKAEGRDERA